MINVLETAPIVGNRMSEIVSTLIGSFRDMADLQRTVIDYNSNMLEPDQVQLDIFPGDDGTEKAMLTGTAMGIFHIGMRLGHLEEKKYLQSLGPTLREIMLA
jgi:tetrahydromethanopterin S-methyltransferase subunit B